MEVQPKLCDLCMQNPCHSRCPNYTPPKITRYCSSCGEGIYAGEEYIENEDGEYQHYECFLGMKDLLKWLGYKIKIMEEEYD